MPFLWDARLKWVDCLKAVSLVSTCIYEYRVIALILANIVQMRDNIHQHQCNNPYIAINILCYFQLFVAVISRLLISLRATPCCEEKIVRRSSGGDCGESV